jgi:lipid A ethanolaminephosphotransferase
MVVWMSDQFRQDLKLGYDCIKAPSLIKMSHDNFFHSVLGMLDITTTERNQDLDIFASCRTARQIALQ